LTAYESLTAFLTASQIVLTALTAKKKLERSFDRSFDRVNFRIDIKYARRLNGCFDRFSYIFPSMGS
jgi:hypothetical protein